MIFRDAVKSHELFHQIAGVGQGGLPVDALIDANLHADGIAIGDAVGSMSVAAMPGGVGIFDDLHHALVVHEIMGACPSVAAGEIAVMGHGVGAAIGIARVVDDDVGDAGAVSRRIIIVNQLFV